MTINSLLSFWFRSVAGFTLALTRDIRPVSSAWFPYTALQSDSMKNLVRSNQQPQLSNTLQGSISLVGVDYDG